MDIDRVRADNAAVTDAERKGGLIINSGREHTEYVACISYDLVRSLGFGNSTRLKANDSCIVLQSDHGGLRQTK